MKRIFAVSIVLAFAPVSQAADIEAGKARVASVCAACHGTTGVSVSESIPNLAGQRAGYIETQLKALKNGARKFDANMSVAQLAAEGAMRKHDIMNAIAAQLSAEEMANVAAYFAAQLGADGGAKSSFLPNFAK